MSFSLDPVFETQAMVKILESQGLYPQAIALCQKLLAARPADAKLKVLLKELKATAAAKTDHLFTKKNGE